MTYYQVIKNMSNAFDLRLRMVKMAGEEGISATARYYRTTRKTVRKWVRRYRQGGLKALEDRKRAPKRIPHKMPKELEKRIVELRKRYPGWGPKRLKTYFNLACSEGAIHRVLKQNGLIRKRKKKWKKRRDLRKLKAALRPFEKLILDGKDLKDIEHYWSRHWRDSRDCRAISTQPATFAPERHTSRTAIPTIPQAPLSSCGMSWSVWQRAEWTWGC
jgi:transposase-like protein